MGGSGDTWLTVCLPVLLTLQVIRSAPQKALDFFIFDGFKRLLMGPEGAAGGSASRAKATGAQASGSSSGSEAERSGSKAEGMSHGQAAMRTFVAAGLAGEAWGEPEVRRWALCALDLDRAMLLRLALCLAVVAWC